MKFHVHRDPNWEIHGANAYHQCQRCGARRVIAYYRNIASPTTPGWPHLVDRHGRSVADTGWMPAPADGWSTRDHLSVGPGGRLEP